ncbi:poly-gamma-glutamate hydrolase family protein, partial [Staphylococcus haemolyticus]|uniref:poly-gamma-glutamate hydrolase family protein n=1 Tax=Staphylococcus haemolyticus TaxID=1283 RepID=UPI0021B475B3
MHLVKTTETPITIHPSLPQHQIAYIPPKHNLLKHPILQQLTQIPIQLKQPPTHISPTQHNNILNCTKNPLAVQIHLTSTLTNSLFKNNNFNPKTTIHQSNSHHK